MKNDQASIKQYMDEISIRAKERGLTPEKLKSLLEEGERSKKQEDFNSEKHSFAQYIYVE